MDSKWLPPTPASHLDNCCRGIFCESHFFPTGMGLEQEGDGFKGGVSVFFLSCLGRQTFGFFFSLCFCFETGSLSLSCISGWPQTNYIAEDDPPASSSQVLGARISKLLHVAQEPPPSPFLKVKIEAGLVAGDKKRDRQWGQLSSGVEQGCFVILWASSWQGNINKCSGGWWWRW